jgi:hypothetical protein
MSIDAAIISIDSRVGQGFRPDKLHSERGLASRVPHIADVDHQASKHAAKAAPHAAKTAATHHPGIVFSGNKPTTGETARPTIQARSAKFAATTYLQPPEAKSGRTTNARGRRPGFRTLTTATTSARHGHEGKVFYS